MTAAPVSAIPSVAPANPLHTGMGAIPYAGGVTFRVWSVFADSVSVVGDFNAWSTTATPLARDGAGNYWSVDVPGATVGQAYKFFLPYAAKPGRNGYRIDPYARSVKPDAANVMNSIVASNVTAYDSGSYSTPPWNQAVIYELHIPTFNATPGGPPGTFDTAMMRLPELAQLGINAIEIMPLGQFSGNASTGYNPGYIFAVEDAFGGPDGFRTYVNAAHSLGIAVILDVVYNHVEGLDLWQFDGWSMDDRFCSWCAPHPPPVAVNGGIYFFADSRAHTPFSHARFDVGRPEVGQYLFDNVTSWLENRFLDGLRLDSTVSIRNIQNQYDNWKLEQAVPEGISLLQRFNQRVQSTQPWKIMIAEDLQSDGSITAPVGAGGGYGFNAQWDDNFCGKLRWAAIAPADNQRKIDDLGGAIAAMNGANAFQSILYDENHDKDDPRQGGRLPAIIGNGVADSWFARKQSTLAACVALTAPGIPMLFMGQEFLEYRPFPNYGGYPDPIDWSRKDTYSGIWGLYRDMIRLRRNRNANTRGLQGRNIHVLPVFGDNVLVFHRWDQGGQGDDVLVVCNFASQSYKDYQIGMPKPGMWRVRFNSDASAYGFGNWASYDTDANGPALSGMPYSADVSLGAYTCLVLSQD